MYYAKNKILDLEYQQLKDFLFSPLCDISHTEWWRHQMETFSALLAICAGNSPVTGEFPAQRPVTRSFDVLFIFAWQNGWVSKGEAGDLRCHRAHYDVTVMNVHGFIVLWFIVVISEAPIKIFVSSDVIWRQRSRSTLIQVMACCLAPPGKPEPMLTKDQWGVVAFTW